MMDGSVDDQDTGGFGSVEGRVIEGAILEWVKGRSRRRGGDGNDTDAVLRGEGPVLFEDPVEGIRVIERIPAWIPGGDEVNARFGCGSAVSTGEETQNRGPVHAYGIRWNALEAVNLDELAGVLRMFTSDVEIDNGDANATPRDSLLMKLANTKSRVHGVRQYGARIEVGWKALLRRPPGAKIETNGAQEFWIGAQVEGRKIYPSRVVMCGKRLDSAKTLNPEHQSGPVLRIE